MIVPDWGIITSNIILESLLVNHSQLPKMMSLCVICHHNFNPIPFKTYTLILLHIRLQSFLYQVIFFSRNIFHLKYKIHAMQWHKEIVIKITRSFSYTMREGRCPHHTAMRKRGGTASTLEFEERLGCLHYI